MKLGGKIDKLVDWQKVNAMVLHYQDTKRWVQDNKVRKWIYNIVFIVCVILVVLIIRWLVY